MATELPRIDYLSHPAYGGMLAPDAAAGAEALAVLGPLIEEMAEVEAQRAGRFGYDYGVVNRQGEELAERGVTQVRLPDELMDPVHAAAQPVIGAMQARIAETRAAGRPIHFKTVEEKLAQESHGALWKAVDRFLREIAIYDTVTAFFQGKSARINGMALFVNPPSQEWANRLFKDVKLETPPTAGFHIDSNGKCYIKGILHLNDVGADQGPTGVVPKSHLWGQGGRDRIVRRAFDRSPLLARSTDARRKFISLPPELQVKAEFGGDMMPDTPEAQMLVSEELRAVGPRGLLTLFDPDAVHRGGNVRSGERHALQLVLTAQY
ncbi:MAG TPA: phytanoyl-CoA dioxygenase family protein [Caulobacteraceae bacterium]|jgi:hypothetical protein|nr:phytanoyl-CoA dioxygenase family protein [Caulobacteraceae bacterium]